MCKIERETYVNRKIYPFRLGCEAHAPRQGELCRAGGPSYGTSGRENHDYGDFGEREQPGQLRRQVQPCGHQGAELEGRDHHSGGAALS